VNMKKGNARHTVRLMITLVSTKTQPFNSILLNYYIRLVVHAHTAYLREDFDVC
jgi:hypothetical protein